MPSRLQPTVSLFDDSDLDRSVIGPFLRHAAARPDRLAVSGRRHRFTYGEVYDRARAIAEVVLERLPANSESARVGLLCHHDAVVVTGIVGVILAGAVPVVLDPGDPSARHRVILEDADPFLVLIDDAHAAMAAAFAADHRPVVNVESGLKPASRASFQAPASGNASAILYTSGSSGRPKGVVRPHRTMLHNARSAINLFGISGRDRLSQFASSGLAAGTNALWAALSAGASLHMYPIKREGLNQLVSWLRDERITVFHSSTTVLRYLAGLLGVSDRFPDIRVLRVGGEAVLGADVPIHARHFSADSLFANVYSATEVGIVTACAILASDAGTDLVPLGWPVPGKDVRVVGGDGEPLDPGCTGDVVVVSRYLCDGYWRAPDLNRERYTWDADGVGTYRTGDRGRFRPDGCLEFEGRGDRRVKIRGYRVELEEVESRLSRHAGIGGAAVVTHDDGDQALRLVAFVTPTRGRRLPSGSELRRFLLETLPDALVPSRFLAVDALPLGPSGKIDRAALEALVRDHRPAALESPPQSDRERTLVGIMADVLRVASLGRDDDFFLWGGDSLRASHVLARVSQAFGVQVPFRAFLQNATAAALARVIDRGVAGGSVVPPAHAPIPRRTRADRAPIAPVQRRLWILSRLDPDSSAYNVAHAVRLRGAFDTDAFERALNASVERHAVFRTTFVTEGGEPVQCIADTGAVIVGREDLTAWPAQQRDAALERLMDSEARRPFDLTRDLLIRAAVVHLAADDHAIVIVYHHIASDQWSWEILAQELSAGYSARVAGTPVVRAELPIEFADLATWQHEHDSAEWTAREIGYWKQQLAGAPEEITWPRRPGLSTVRGQVARRQPITLAVPVTDALEALARGEQATLFMVMLAALQALLHRQTGMDDIVVGSPVSGRTRPESEPLIGFFANTVAFRTRVDGHLTFRDLLGQVREVALDAHDHQLLPFDRLVEELSLRRRAGVPPVVQVVLGLSSSTGNALEFAGAVGRSLELPAGQPKFDLTVSLQRSPDGLGGYVEYDTAVFDDAAIDRTCAHLGRLIEAVVADPDCAIGSIPLVTESERRTVIAEWNDTGTAFAADRTLADLVAESVARTPAALAIVDCDRAWTYAQLDERAQTIARWLQGLGLGTGDHVGLVMERSAAMVAAIVGVVHAQAAYVPIDPTHPPERIGFMLSDASAAFVLASQTVAGGLPADGPPVLLLSDEGWPVSATAAARRPEARPPSTALDIVCVMYTSGTTGGPKGVAIPHRAIARLVLATNYLTITASDVIAHASNPAFDASTFEIWGALLNGARIAVLSADAVLGPARLEAELVRYGVTTMFLPTALFHRLATEAPRALRSLTTLLCGGEALQVPAASTFAAAAPGVRLVNVYGPTETTTFAAWHTVTPQDIADGILPIGRPLSNTELYVLDEERQPVPVGILGEIAIGGAGLARGYLNRPELTASVFVDHPFSPGQRLYCTGDRGWYRADGAVVFHGRSDGQVKIRGFRVDPVEVEAVLIRHPAVRAAAVADAVNDRGDRSLVGYVVPQADTPQPAALAAFLSRSLPAYMVPETFVALDALPLTRNGKVDRAALPQPETSSRAAPYVPPQGDLEARIAAIWCATLQVDRVGRHDNFFALGGHSLVLVQLIARLERELGVSAAASWLFETPTFGDFCGRMALSTDRGVSTIPRRVDAEAAVPASAVQWEAWRRREVQPADCGYMVVRAFDVTGPLDIRALSSSLDELVRRHEVLRTGLVELDGKLFQQILPRYTVDVHRLESSNAADAATLADREFERALCDPFHLTYGPWLRASVVELGDERYRLILSMAHVVYDAWSLDRLYEELETFYAAARRGESGRIDAAAVQYADYVAWLGRQGAPDRDERQLTFWRERLRGLDERRLPCRRRTARHLVREATRLRRLPGLDRPGPRRVLDRAASIARAALGRAQATSTNGNEGRLPIALERGLTAALRRLARAEETTLFVTMLAGLKTVLFRDSADPDVAVAAFSANRPRAILHDVIGHLGNTIAIRTDLGGDPPFRSLVRRLASEVVAAQLHGEVPFDAVSRAVTRAGQLPLEHRIPVVFQLIERLRIVPRLTGTTVEPVRTQSRYRSPRISVTLFEWDGGVRGDLTFNPTLYDRAGCLELVARFERTLTRAAEQPDAPLSRL